MTQEQAPLAIALIAALGLGLGSCSHSWWSDGGGMAWSGIGLRGQKVCFDPPGMSSSCQSFSFELLARQWATMQDQLPAQVDALVDQVGASHQVGAAQVDAMREQFAAVEVQMQSLASGGFRTLGTWAFYLGLVAAGLLALAVFLANQGDERAAQVSLVAAIACAGALLVAAGFVAKIPSFFTEAGKGYSMFGYLGGSVAGAVGMVMLRRSLAKGIPVGFASPAAAGSPRRVGRGGGSSAQPPVCGQCQSPATWREDVKCYICSRCGTAL